MHVFSKLAILLHSSRTHTANYVNGTVHLVVCVWIVCAKVVGLIPLIGINQVCQRRVNGA